MGLGGLDASRCVTTYSVLLCNASPCVVVHLTRGEQAALVSELGTALEAERNASAEAIADLARMECEKSESVKEAQRARQLHEVRAACDRYRAWTP